MIETKIDGATINGGYGQGGLIAYADGDNYVKFDAISDVGQTRASTGSSCARRRRVRSARTRPTRRSRRA